MAVLGAVCSLVLVLTTAAPGGAVVFGGDERAQITNPLDHGVGRATALLIITDDVGRLSACSGVMISRDTLATAAHCLLAADGSRARSIRVEVARRQIGTYVERPFGTCNAVGVWYPREWGGRDVRFDYGAVKLDCQVGFRSGWLAMAAPATLRGAPITEIGFPGDRRGEMWMSRGNVEWEDTWRLWLRSNDTGPGQSGSGAYTIVAGCGLCLVGVLSGSTDFAIGATQPGPWNRTTRLTPRAVSELSVIARS